MPPEVKVESFLREFLGDHGTNSLAYRKLILLIKFIENNYSAGLLPAGHEDIKKPRIMWLKCYRMKPVYGALLMTFIVFQFAIGWVAQV